MASSSGEESDRSSWTWFGRKVSHPSDCRRHLNATQASRDHGHGERPESDAEKFADRRFIPHAARKKSENEARFNVAAGAAFAFCFPEPSPQEHRIDQQLRGRKKEIGIQACRNCDPDDDFGMGRTQPHHNQKVAAEVREEMFRERRIIAVIHDDAVREPEAR